MVQALILGNCQTSSIDLRSRITNAGGVYYVFQISGSKATKRRSNPRVDTGGRISKELITRVFICDARRYRVFARSPWISAVRLTPGKPCQMDLCRYWA